jgi:hypothetical protein
MFPVISIRMLASIPASIFNLALRGLKILPADACPAAYLSAAKPVMEMDATPVAMSFCTGSCRL